MNCLIIHLSLGHSFFIRFTPRNSHLISWFIIYLTSREGARRDTHKHFLYPGSWYFFGGPHFRIYCFLGVQHFFFLGTRFSFSIVSHACDNVKSSISSAANKKSGISQPLILDAHGQTTAFPRLAFWSRDFNTAKFWHVHQRFWSHAISHLGSWLLHCSLRVIKLQSRFKVYKL
jgi:hypothetical protein